MTALGVDEIQPIFRDNYQVRKVYKCMQIKTQRQ